MVFIGLREGKDGTTKLYIDIPDVAEFYLEPVSESVDWFLEVIHGKGIHSWMVSSDLHHPEEFPEISYDIFRRLGGCA